MEKQFVHNLHANQLATNFTSEFEWSKDVPVIGVEEDNEVWSDIKPCNWWKTK